MAVIVLSHLHSTLIHTVLNLLHWLLLTLNYKPAAFTYKSLSVTKTSVCTYYFNHFFSSDQNLLHLPFKTSKFGTHGSYAVPHLSHEMTYHLIRSLPNFDLFKSYLSVYLRLIINITIPLPPSNHLRLKFRPLCLTVVWVTMGLFLRNILELHNSCLLLS